MDVDNKDAQTKWIAALEKSDKWLRKAIKDAVTTNELYLPNATDTQPSNNNNKLRYGLFNSNVNVLKGTMFARLPEPTVSRQFQDVGDQTSRVASLILERAVTYDLHATTRIRDAIKSALTDYLVGGYGWLYARFDADVENPLIVSGNEIDDLAEGSDVIKSQHTSIEYVNYKDVRWSTARNWDEVTWWARRVYMCEEDFTQRFGADAARKVDFATEPDDDADGENLRKTEFSEGKVSVWEIWDKETRKVYYVVKFMGSVLDVIDDPYGLPEFFPTMPMFANVSNDAFVPISDFVLLERQYRDHSAVTARLARLCKSVRVAGIYDSSIQEVKQLLESTDDSVMVPVAGFRAIEERGGLSALMSFLPLKEFAETINLISTEKAGLEAQIDQFTGISDIIRGGNGQQYESAAASRLKSQYANVRLGNKSDDLAHVVTYLIKCMAHFICKFYTDEQIIQRIGVLNEVDSQYLPQALQLLRNELARVMRIEVSTDSLKAPDFARDTAEKTGLLQQLAAFIPQAIQSVGAMPELAPAMFGAIGWALAGTRGAREIEGQLEQALQSFLAAQAQKAANPEPPKPDPAMAQIQAQLEMAQQKQETERLKLQMEHDREQAKMQQEYQLKQAQLANDAQRLVIEQQRLELEQARIALAQDELETQAVIAAQRLKQEDEQFMLKLAASSDGGSIPEQISKPDVSGLDVFNPLASLSTNVHISNDHTPDGY